MVSEADRKLWDEHKQAWANYQHKSYLLKKNIDDLPGLIKAVLSEYPSGIGALIELIDELNTDQLIDLLPLMLDQLTNGSGRVPHRDFMKKILKLPKDWLKENIEAYAEKILNTYNKDDQHQAYAWLLNLYAEIDRDMALKLTEQVIAHSDPDVQELGQFWKEELLGTNQSEA